MTLGLLRCVPVFTRDRLRQSDSLPKYLVIPGSLVEYMGQDDTRITIIDLGEGSSWAQSRYRVLSSRSIFQHRSTSKFPHSVASSSTGDHVQSSPNVAQGRTWNANRRLVDRVSGTALQSQRGAIRLTL